ncbi:hypothetical protein MTO96_047509 [Rhipicephalus appendiculatus]
MACKAGCCIAPTCTVYNTRHVNNRLLSARIQTEALLRFRYGGELDVQAGREAGDEREGDGKNFSNHGISVGTKLTQHAGERDVAMSPLRCRLYRLGCNQACIPIGTVMQPKTPRRTGERPPLRRLRRPWLAGEQHGNASRTARAT